MPTYIGCGCSIVYWHLDIIVMEGHEFKPDSVVE